uniref:U2 snRNP-associated SURP motif-containing protein n=2 Tax=Aceria tosichella TaxID=561515 RepID=A0A6G1S3S7_9ACAR
MPKFVSGSSGTLYAPDKLKKDEDEILAALEEQDKSNDVKKPSAVNKKGTKEKQKSSLDLFKEELRKLNEEQEEQRNKLKNSLNDHQSHSNTTSSTQQKPPAPAPLIPVPLLPDPRCPTTLTLQVNLNPKDKDAPSSGSFDTGDPTTTNLYIGNLNPTVTENDLCDIFGKFGPLASIKIMWPRTDEERARNRNSGFVAYMSRIDGERALKVLNGMELRGYDMKLGWGKAVPLPKNPVFVPAELIKFLQPPPKSGLPFNAQLHASDVERSYIVPTPIPRPVPSELMPQLETDPELVNNDKKYQEFIQVFQRSTVHVCVPQDRSLLDRIHKTIEFVIREGPVFESIITAREHKNSDYSFLYDYDSAEHIYYRWRLYSILHGDNPYAWRTEEFRMFEGGPLWRPPPLNPFADGMPLELVEKLTGISKDTIVNAATNAHRLLNFNEKSASLSESSSSCKSKLNQAKSRTLRNILRDLEPTKTSIGSAMLFCINHSYAAEEIIDSIKDSLSVTGTSIKRKLALLFLISDILNNSSASVTNASYFREGFRDKLDHIFLEMRDYLSKLEDVQQVKKLNQKILNVLGAWKYYQLYEDEFVLKLSNTLFGSSADRQRDESVCSSGLGSLEVSINLDGRLTDSQLDGEPIDDATLAECLERKGLSLRWYKTLELSDDEADVEYQSPQDGHTSSTADTSPKDDAPKTSTAQSVLSKERFKVSKWELVTDEPGHSPSSLTSGLVLSEKSTSSTTSETPRPNDQPN